MRDTNVIHIDSYVIKNTHIDFDKETYDVLNDSIVKPLNGDMKTIINEDTFVYFMWNEG